MRGLLLILLTIVLSHKVIVDYGTSVEGLTTLSIITLDSYGYFYPYNNVAIRTYHDGDCTFLSSSIVEVTVAGRVYFEVLCVCPNFEMCKVSFTAKDFSVGSTYINTYFGDDFKINRQIDKFWVTVGHSFNVKVQYMDENGYSLDSPILVDDYKGEIITSTTIADQKNGLAEFNLTYSTTGLKTFRIITNYLIFSDDTGFLIMHQIVINQVNIIKDIRNTSLVLNNNDFTKQIIYTNEPFSVTLQAFEPGATKIDIKEQSKVKITISSTESENATISGSFVNGVVIFNNLVVLYYGSYNIVTTPDGFNTAMISKNVTGYLKINFVDGITPYDYNTYFSVIVEVFKDAYFYIKDSKAFILITLVTDPYIKIQGSTSGITQRGEIVFPYLKLPKEGTYDIIAFYKWMANATTTKFNIYETDKVHSIELKTNLTTNSIEINKPILIIASLFDYKNYQYLSDVMVYLDISPLSYSGKTIIESILGKAFFSLTFLNTGIYSVNATTMLDYTSIATQTLNIIVYDLHCGINEIYKNNQCECIENSSFNETSQQCECYESYINKNKRCEKCVRTFQEENITAYYDQNYKKIFISFSIGVLEARHKNCSDFITLPSGLDSLIKSCEWLGNSIMVLEADEVIIPANYFIEIDKNLTPEKSECYEIREPIKVYVNIKYTGYLPDFEIQGPAYVSRGNCQSSKFVVTCVPNDNNFNFLWKFYGMDRSFTTNPIELDVKDFLGNEIVITLIVEYVPFKTSAEKIVTIAILDDLSLKMTTNLGKSYSMTKTETVELKPILLDSCGAGNLISEFYFKLISGSIPYFINTLIENREREDMLLIKGQELDAGTYTIQLGILIQGYSGYENTQITVLYNELCIVFYRWDGIQGLDIDLEVLATTNSTDNNNIIYKWNCFNENKYCTDSQNQSIFFNPTTNKFVISKNNLQDSANYTIVCYAENIVTKKSATKEIHIQINSGYYGSIIINSIMDLVKISQEVVIYPITSYDNNVDYIWEFDPLLENCNVDYKDLILKIPPWCLESSMNYDLTLTAMNGKPIGKVVTQLRTPEIPKCSNFSVEFAQNDKWKLDAVGCSSKNSRVTYQFGCKFGSDIITWLTAELETNAIDLFLEDSITSIVVRVADLYGWIDIESPIIRKLRVLSSDNSNMQIDYTPTNSDVLLADFRYFISEIMSTSDYFKFIDKIIVYFTTGKMTQGTFKSFLSFLQTCSQTGAFNIIEYASKLMKTTIEILAKYNKTLENQEFQDLMSIFDKTQFSYEVADLYLLSSILWSQNVYPFSSGKYSNNIEIAYSQLPLKALNQTDFSFKNMQISLTKTSKLDENFLYSFLYFYINPLNFGVFLYKIAEKISDVSYIPLKNPELVSANNATYKIQLTSDEYVYSDYVYSIFSDQVPNKTYPIKRINSDKIYFHVNDNGFFTITSPTKIFRTSKYNLIVLLFSAPIPIFCSIFIHRLNNERNHVDYYFRDLVDLKNLCKKASVFIQPIMIMQFSIGYFVNLLYNMKMKQNCNFFDKMDLVNSTIGSLVYNIFMGLILIALYKVDKKIKFFNNDTTPKKHFFVVFGIWVGLFSITIGLEIVTRNCFNIYWFLFCFLMHLLGTSAIWIPLSMCFRGCNSQIQAQ